MNLKFLENIRYPDKFITACLLCLFVTATFKFAADSGMRKSIAEPTGWYVRSMCAAISSLKYGRNGYVCYEKIFEKLYPLNELYWNPGNDPQAINRTIATALTLKDQGDGIYTMGEMDIGYIDYCRLAFSLFGYNIEGLFYTYLLLFLIPVLIFFVTFRKNRMAMLMLLTFLLAHYVVVRATQAIGPNLGSVHCYRFMPVLAILPVMHVLMLALFDRPLRTAAFIGALIQSILFTFVIWIRGSVMWMAALLLIYVTVGLFKGQAKHETLARNLKTKWWPVLLVLSIVVISKITVPFLLDPAYKKSGGISHHIVWHSIYLGLALHPQIRGNYSAPIDGIREEDKIYLQVCSQNIHGNAIKVAVKKWMCNHYGAYPWILEGVYQLDYPPNDQDGYSAGFNWLYNHGISEYYLFNFRPEDKVDYKTPFTWFNVNPPTGLKRRFRWEKDFNWSLYDSVLADVVKNVVRNYPLQVIQEMFIDKPVRYLCAYFKYYLSVNNLLLLFVPITLVHFFVMAGRSSRSEIFQGLKLLAVMFVFSLIPTLLIYPSNLVIADSALVFTMCIFYSIFVISFYAYKKYTSKSTTVKSQMSHW